MTLIIDSHFHLYRSAEDGLASKGDYEVWEYGKRDEPVHLTEASGDLESSRQALADAGTAAAVVATLYEPQPGDASPRDELIGFDRWVCEVAAEDARFYPLIGVDPGILSIEENVHLIRELASTAGARGIKIHPPLQRLDLADPALWPLFAVCNDLGLVVLSHSGPSRDGKNRGVPNAFRPVLAEYPRLKIVLAHMGGATWRQTAGVAKDFPSVRFDLCEIIERLGAEEAPTPLQLAQLIREVGVERVLMGSDFPWYDIAHTVGLVEDLPLLTAGEKEAILGSNAAQFLGIPV